MYLGICEVSRASAGPSTPEKRAPKRQRPSDAAVSSNPHAPAAAAAPAEVAAAEALRALSATAVCHKKRLCFLFADSPEKPAIVGAMLVHQFGEGNPFKALAEFAGVPVPLHLRQPVAITQRAAAYLRGMPTPLMFQDFSDPDTPPELNDIFEALHKSGNLSSTRKT